MGSSHKKQGKIGINNAKKAKVFSKLVRLIQVEAKKANGNTASPGLASAIKKAYKANMPKDNIERAVKKASDVGDAKEQMYEAYGPGGIGMIITTLTDNTNRTSQEIRSILSKNSGSLGTPGSVAWNFTQNQERDWVANTPMEIDGETKENLDLIIDLLTENDDVQDVYHSAV